MVWPASVSDVETKSRAAMTRRPARKPMNCRRSASRTIERELAGGAIVVVREVDAIPAALLRVSRLAIIDFDERFGP
jgi:hypothetical protein